MLLIFHNIIFPCLRISVHSAHLFQILVIFDDLFGEYTSSYELVNVKTTNMGSMFRLTYDVTLKDPDKEKELIDKIRCRNGNLEINVSRQASAATEL